MVSMGVEVSTYVSYYLRTIVTTLGAARGEYDTLSAARAAMGNAGGAMGGGTRSNRVGRQDSGGTMDGTMSSERQTK
jgi:hypothetical protein